MASSRRRLWLWLLASIALAGLLALAWFDGGERALRPIAEEIAIPEAEQ